MMTMRVILFEHDDQLLGKIGEEARPEIVSLASDTPIVGESLMDVRKSLPRIATSLGKAIGRKIEKENHDAGHPVKADNCLYCNINTEE